MKTANELRTEMASGQRMAKTRVKWRGWCERFKDRLTITGNNNISIGDKVEFRVTKSNGYGCINSGIVFALSDKGGTMMVASSGCLMRVSNSVDEEV